MNDRRCRRILLFVVLSVVICKVAAKLPKSEIDALCDIANVWGCSSCRNGCGTCGSTCDENETTVIKLVLPCDQSTPSEPVALPSSISNFTNMRVLKMVSCNIYKLPDTLGKLSHLETLIVMANNIAIFPESLANLQSLTSVTLNAVTFGWPIPKFVSRLGKLTYLDVQQNALSSFPESLPQSLTYLDASQNSLSALPDWLPDLKNLTSLRLQANRFAVFPSIITRTRSLSDLYIGSNSLLDSIPESIDNLVSLESFSVGDCILSVLPSTIGSLKKLSYLNLRSNLLTVLTASFVNLGSLTLLGLSYNRITALPEGIGAMKRLTDLSLTFNQLTSLPSSIGSLNFTALMMDKNFFDCDSINVTGPFAQVISECCLKEMQRYCDTLDALSCPTFLVCKWDERAGACVKGSDCEIFGPRAMCTRCRVGFGPDAAGVCQDCSLRSDTYSNGTTGCTSCLSSHCTSCVPKTGKCTRCVMSIPMGDGLCHGFTGFMVMLVGFAIANVGITAFVVSRIRRKFNRVRLDAEATALLVPRDSPQRSLIGLSRFECTDGAGLGVVVSPAVLTFGTIKKPLSVNEPFIDFLTITGVNKKSTFRIMLPDDGPDRFSLVTTAVSGTVTKSKRMIVELTLTLTCTTRIGLKAYVIVDERRFAEFYINAESALSSQVDASELEIGAILGTGGFGSVYGGVWRGMQVAIKSYNESVVNDEVMRRDIEREAEMCTTLRHPNVVSFFGSARAPGKFYIVMELVPNGSLDGAVRKAPLDPRFKIRVLLDVARGMDFLHQNRIIHRDLKTANVLVASFDPAAQVCGKLSDFNTSRFIGAEDCTKTKGVGTPVFMAPEILNVERHYTGAVDVFSFGVLAWNVWTQKEPFAEFDDQFAIINFVLVGKRLRIPDDVPVPLRDAINVSWAANPNQRPTFQQLIHEIAGITL